MVLLIVMSNEFKVCNDVNSVLLSYCIHWNNNMSPEVCHLQIAQMSVQVYRGILASVVYTYLLLMKVFAAETHHSR